MTGKSHKTIGAAAGIALFIYGMRNGNYDYAPMLLTAPAGAMLPDIDCKTSKLGRTRNTIVKVTLALVFAAFAGYCGYTYFKHGNISSILNTALWALVPILIFMLLNRIKALNKILKFSSKHRGITHTLILPALFFAGYFFIKENILQNAVLGLSIGSLSHVIADCLNPKGCPVLFPITTKSIHIAKIPTGSMSEYLVTFILSGLLIGLAVLL